MPDTFDTHAHGLESPASRAALITPSDSTDLAFATRAIMVGGSGTLRVRTVGGDDVVLPAGAINAGTIIPLRVVRVFSTSTTATNLVALW
jgi:hypothetical protein